MELAERLGQNQSFVAKAEGGDRRLDRIQLRTILGVIGTTSPTFVARLEDPLAVKAKKGK